MTFLRKTPVIRFSALTALATAVGCSREEDTIERVESDLTSTGTLRELVISQSLRQGAATPARPHDLRRALQPGDHGIARAERFGTCLVGRELHEGEEPLTLPDTTAARPSHYFLIQLATGAAAG